MVSSDTHMDPIRKPSFEMSGQPMYARKCGLPITTGLLLKRLSVSKSSITITSCWSGESSLS